MISSTRVLGAAFLTLLLSVLAIGGGQAKKEDKVVSDPPFTVLNDSITDSNISLPELIDSYEASIGGKEAIDAIHTVVAYQTRVAHSPLGDKREGKLLQYFKTPNKAKTLLTMADGKLDITGFDGTSGWYDSPGKGLHLVPEAKAVAAQELNLFNNLHLRNTHPQMKLLGTSKIEGRDLYIVDASIKEWRIHRNLFFDAETKLLIGSITIQESTAKRPMLILEDSYSNFRVVNGVKFPFVVRTFEHTSGVTSVTKRTRIKCNVPLRDAFFVASSTATEGN